MQVGDVVIYIGEDRNFKAYKEQLLTVAAIDLVRRLTACQTIDGRCIVGFPVRDLWIASSDQEIDD